MAGAWQGCHEVWSSFWGKPTSALSTGSGVGLAGEQGGQAGHAIKPPCLQQHIQLIVYITLLAVFVLWSCPLLHGMTHSTNAN